MEDTKLILMFSIITLIAITYIFFRMALIYKEVQLNRLERVKNDLQDTKQKLQNVNDQIEANNKRIQELKSNIK